MTKRELVQLEMSRRTYETIPTKEMSERVTDLERVLNEKLDIWTDEDQYERFQMVNKLNTSDRRLLIVYSLLGASVARTAAYFSVSRKTIETNVNRIKALIQEN